MLENYLDRSLVRTELASSTKDGILRELAGFITLRYRNIPEDAIVEALSEREMMGSTAIEQGIAIPHAKIDGIDKLTIAVGRSKEGVDFNSHDGGPTRLFFVFLAPENTAGEHMKVLARLAKLLSVSETREKMLIAKDADALYNVILEADKKLC